MQNYGVVKEAFVSYARDGKPRGFGFVVFDDPSVANRVVQNKHTIDRREVCFAHICNFAHSQF
jgi:RNA-binding protein Musashi